MREKDNPAHCSCQLSFFQFPLNWYFFCYPLGLNSTVTAGIVSAKGRNINILKENFAVESFIQTDAAINPGNSGGALVNLNGGLVGINTAIASPTGAYAGYGFAVPSNIVSKVVAKGEKPHAVLQKLGADLETLPAEKAEALGIDGGVQVKALYNGKIRQYTNMQEGFIITKVDGEAVTDCENLIARLEDKPAGGLLLEGIYEDVPGERYYAFGW